RRRGKRAEQPDRTAADHGDRVARVDSPGGDGRVVRDRERFDERALAERELLGDLVQPRGLRDEVFGVGAADREAEVVGAVVDDTLADDAVARAERRDGAADIGDLTGPLVTWDDRVRNGDDVPALVELEVGVADADVVRADEDL